MVHCKLKVADEGVQVIQIQRVRKLLLVLDHYYLAFAVGILIGAEFELKHGVFVVV